MANLHAEKGEEASVRAVIAERYGGAEVLQIADRVCPEPGPNEVVVRVAASSLNIVDWVYMRGLPHMMRVAAGVRRPKQEQRGRDFAGTVEAIGTDVTDLAPGDEVFGLKAGAWAERIAVPRRQLVKKPASLSLDEASCLPIAGLTAIQAIRDHAAIKNGDRVLIIGASGGVGHFAIQFANWYGAEVTAVCSGRNREFVASLGAHRVIDYTGEDYTATGDTYDVIYDLVGSKRLGACLGLLTSEGQYVLGGGEFKNKLLGPIGRMVNLNLRKHFASQTLVSYQARVTQEELQSLARLIEAGAATPSIERRFPLDEVQEAMRHLASRRTRGKVVISFDSPRQR
jgi:NADPH:quinone reductase-like Zn-dependent oxidoreductase